MPEEIRNTKMLVVEGSDDVCFFTTLLKKLNIEGVYVSALGSKYGFNEDLPDIQKRQGFSSLTHLGLIRDKDEDNAFESVKNILQRKMNFETVPNENGQFARGEPNVGILIMPGSGVEGTMLEDLCLETVKHHEAMTCVDDFMECVSTLENPPLKPAKSKVQAFLAAQPQTVSSVGIAAQKSYWNMDSPVLSELKAFLENFR